MSGRLHNIVWAFLVLIIASSYLANLASFLVIQTQEAPTYHDINSVVAAKAKVCIDATDATTVQFFSQYPNNYYAVPHQIGYAKPQELVTAMRQGLCVGCILRSSAVDILQTDSTNCDLTKRSAITAPLGAGFGFPSQQCGPFYLAVIDALLIEIEANGKLEAIWQTVVPPALCPPKSTLFNVASSTALSVESFAGLFILYLAFVFCAGFFRLARRLCVKAEHKVLSRVSRDHIVARLSKSETFYEMAELKAQTGDTPVNVRSKDSDLMQLDAQVSRIDRSMAEILATVRQLGPPKEKAA